MTLDAAFEHLPALTTERLRLRQMRPDDAQAVFAFKSDPHVTRCYGQEPHLTDAETMAWIQKRMIDYGSRDCMFWVLTPKDDDIAIGECCFWNFAADLKCAEIGYELHRDHWNAGLMSEALAAVLKFGFEELGLHRIEANPLAGNERSQSLLLNLGFRYEGTLRERHWFQGRFVDQMCFGLLSREWTGGACVTEPR